MKEILTCQRGAGTPEYTRKHNNGNEKMRKFMVAMFCLLTRTDQFGLYDDSGDVKLVDESAKKLRFFAERVEQHCFGEVPCSRRKFETLIPVMVS